MVLPCWSTRLKVGADVPPRSVPNNWEDWSTWLWPAAAGASQGEQDDCGTYPQSANPERHRDTPDDLPDGWLDEGSF